ncbi:MAG TPA: hypothetical protein VGB89_09060 [Bacteroidota bacterium]|jgi:hypothetical protein
MEPVFDLVEAISFEVTEYADRCGNAPVALTVSPQSYRRLLEMKMTEEDSQTQRKTALRYVAIGNHMLKIVIDESLADSEVQVL